MALGLELGMLLTPYPQVFNIPLTTRFVIVTVAAHAIFGLGLGFGNSVACDLASVSTLTSHLRRHSAMNMP